MTGAPYEPPQAPPQGHVPPPRTSRSLLETVRPTEGRMVGGVCEGVGRQLGIDPVVLRVVLAVLTLVGLAGVVVYGAAWLVLPDQRTGRSIAQDHLGVSDRREPQVRPVVLVAAAVAAGISVLGLEANGPWGWGTPFSWFGLLIAGVVLWWVFGSRRGRSGPTGPAGTPPPTPPPSTAPTATWAPSGALPAAPVAGPPPSAGPPPPPRTWAAPPPPPAPRPPRPPNPRHDGGHLALTCLALALVAAGAVGIWSVVVEPLPWGAYPAAVLGVLGLGMLLGSVVGNAWPLTVPTFLAAVALAVTTVIPTPTAGDVLERPTTASQVSSDYTLGVGRIVVDLTDVDDPAALEGRTLEIENGLGEVQVVVPPDLSVEVSTYVRAGQTEVFDRVSSGNLVRLRSGEPAGPHLRVVSTQWVGRTVVTRS